jgi:hypothetical protein
MATWKGCIGSGDDLAPFRAGFGRANWVGADGRLTGHLSFHCMLHLWVGLRRIFFSFTWVPSDYIKKGNKTNEEDCQGNWDCEHRPHC